MRILKYVSDALNLLKIECFNNWLEEIDNGGAVAKLTCMTSFANVLNSLLKGNFEKLLANSDWSKQLFLKYKYQLFDSITAFWQSFVDVANVLFAFGRSIRTGDCDL